MTTQYEVVTQVDPGDTALLPFEITVDPQAFGGSWDDPPKTFDEVFMANLDPQQRAMVKLYLRAPVFQVGEIMVVQGDREVGYPGRKSSKWSVVTETFDNVEDAIARSREVMGL